MQVNNLSNIYAPKRRVVSHENNTEKKIFRFSPSVNSKFSPLFVNGNNLKPLSKDTVSFSGNHEHERINNDKICADVSKDAKKVHNEMTGILSKYFAPLIYDEKNPEGCINPIEARIKDPNSIREKTISKIQDALREDKMNEIFSPYSKKSIKSNIKDISGSRITMRNADEKSGEIIYKLCEMISEEGLIINEIENHFTETKSIRPYFTDEQLLQLEKTVNEQRIANKLEPIKIKPNPKSSGYMALHISFDTTRMGGKHRQNQDYYHELQIIGSDVGLLKDVEDLCYKLKKNLDIKGNHIAYTPFEKFFTDNYPDMNDNSPEAQERRELYEEYTKRAYEIQRNKRATENNPSPENDPKNWSYKYPTIRECFPLRDSNGEIRRNGAGEILYDEEKIAKIPPMLDFNILARIKRDCDDLYKVSMYTDAILNGKEKEIDNEAEIKYSLSV